MSPGQIARRLLGRRFKPLGNAYRRIFVNLDTIARTFSDLLPQRSRILDIGGGDGALVERLLNLRPDLDVTMCDVAPSIGSFLSDKNRAKVRLLSATEFASVTGTFDFVTISDVVHHVPVRQRNQFFAELAASCEQWGCTNLIMKDIEPGRFRSWLSVMADRYITGDRHVALISEAAFARMISGHFPHARRVPSMPDPPNYCELLSWGDHDGLVPVTSTRRG